MTKINIQRTFDPSKVFQTDAGKEVKDFIEAELSVDELVLRTLRNGVSFEDNCYAAVKDVELKHNEAQIISADKPVSGIIFVRTYSVTNYLSAPLHWYYNDQNALTVLAQFNGSPTLAIKIRIVLLFQ